MAINKLRLKYIPGTYAKKALRSLAGVKRLINYSMEDIQDYLEFESFELLRTIDTS